MIVLTDMFGGTPSNLAISIMEHARIEVLAGVNLPMLVKLASVREPADRRGRAHGPGSRPQVHHRRVAAPGQGSFVSDAAAGARHPARLKRSLPIANKRGLHARAAAKFVRTAGQFDAAVRVTFKGQDVSGLSIMGLMMLAAGIGSSIELPAPAARPARPWPPSPPWSKASSARISAAHKGRRISP